MIPVIVGVADIKNRSTAIEHAREPASLMLEAICSAIKDATVSVELEEMLRSSIDSLDVVKTWTWPYTDLPALLAGKLGIQTKHQEYSEHGGNQPAKLLDEAARRIATGENRVAVLTGAEALASLRLDIGGLHSVGAPIHIYPLYENGFRAHRGQSIKDNHEESALLYGKFSRVAASNPYSWNFGKDADTPASIGSISKKNRMICFPYPLLMNAFNAVNLAAACVITSTEFAKKLQVPEERWIYPLGGAGSRERNLFWERPNFFQCSAISDSLDNCLGNSGITSREIDIYDFYSCFPIVPKLACHHLGLSITTPEKPITVLGGLTSFGGAGNNYSMHVCCSVHLLLTFCIDFLSQAITEMTRQLRKGYGHKGLILANGGFLSYQHAICLSTQPRKDKSTYTDSRAMGLKTPDPIPLVDNDAEGDATIETYTVEFNRDGSPQRAYIVGRLTSTNHRFLANDGDEFTLTRLSSTNEEPIGRTGTVMPDPNGEKGQRRNLFFVGHSSRL
ncbi:Thiolase [Penicillium canariense]|uniref:Thiolase n=1 Tax=Penicillium canariense TaxID=189055 RepID=A0A9W9LUE1_9EURO|nr:Thiolase [Penicillium canariense]KAJ5175787.1 Thiolase [Penicillium canariense]